MKNRTLLLVILGIWIGTVSGCSSEGGYPELPSGESPLWITCHQCGKRLDSAQTENRLQIGAGQYIVCSSDCKNKQMAWHRAQFGTPTQK
ncbi:hypothetical protein VN12_12550 [Pirellula sp. SH-Sr6A]|uniref:hypothetical protein n=1 Tax=Pirellula sp. SH-Sr6A TaxID=1632865 RepID=UPI00078EB149|nr:hypothetical protein [Pirellula sp. SH-Sr6A]AMV32950.1 hypothetical protein VN12_12550 [Pirellula sp. SH-Sr6A]